MRLHICIVELVLAGMGLLAGYDSKYDAHFLDSRFDTPDALDADALCLAAGSVTRVLLALAFGASGAAPLDQVWCIRGFLCVGLVYV